MNSMKTLKRSLLCLSCCFTMLFMACGDNSTSVGTGYISTSGWENRQVIYYNGKIYFSHNTIKLADSFVKNKDTFQYLGETHELMTAQEMGGAKELDSYRIENNCEVYYTSNEDKIYIRIDKGLWGIFLPYL